MNKLSIQALEVINHLAPSYNLEFLKEHHGKKLHLHGAGKSVERMGKELKDLGLLFESEYMVGYHSGHPIPDHRSIAAAQKLLKEAKKLGENDLVIFCLSGGASSLMELPIQGIELEELQRIYGDLLLSGKDIHQINVERKKLSQVKGGKLGDAYLPAMVHCFVESDVEGNHIEDVGSSPIVGPNNQHTFEVILDKSHLLSTMKKVLTGFDCFEINGPLEENIKEHLKLLGEHSMLSSCGESPVKVTKKGKGGRNTHWVALMGIELLKQNKQFEILSLGTDGKDGDTDAAGACLDNRIPLEELKAAVSSFDTYTLFEKYDLLIKIEQTGYNLNDLRIINC